jgi:hypothetical protein
VSLEQDITKIMEEDIFKPADSDELSKRRENKFPYLFMRFYAGGGLAKHELIYSNEQTLEGELERFEEECIDSNSGMYIGFLTPEELEEIKKLK